jgi:predicted nucleotidyltransferase component of viral defense system
MIDLPLWVDEEGDPDRKAFRQAVLLILRSIAQSSKLSPVMVMKGGVLLAIRYQSSRFTTDIDFSTSQKFQDADIPTLLTDIENALAAISSDNEYALALSLQSHEIKPSKRPNVSFPTLQMRIGYASRLNPKLLRNLEAKRSSKIVQIDYSFNEWASDIEVLRIDHGSLSMYPFHDLVAEKLRSVLQQPVRKRARFQDIYDLFLLLDRDITEEDRKTILSKLIEASRDREVNIHQAAMRDEQVILLSRSQYDTALPSLVTGAVPSFDVAYKTAQDFFENLPW